MSELFLKIINMSISASWLIIAVLLARIVLRKAPKWIHVVLWGIAGLRLICPFSLESALSLVPSSTTISSKVLSGSNFTIQSGISAIDSSVNSYLADHYFEGVTVESNTGFQVIQAFAIIWIIGMAVMLAYTAISYIRLCKSVSTAVKVKDNIYQSENISSPFVFGIIIAKIYLPFYLDEQDMEYVIAHEKAHIQRKDHWWKFAGFILLTIYWFNPLIWLAYVLLCRDIELACDEKVIHNYDREKKADYMQALLTCSIKRHGLILSPLSFGEVGVKERVRSIMNYKKPAFWIIIVSLITCLIIAVCFLTNPKQDAFDIRIVIPAGSENEFYYSDEEIASAANQITLSIGSDTDDCEVVLLPVETKREKTYKPIHLTQGMSTKIDVEKDGWYKIGIQMLNPSDEDIDVRMHVQPVEVRIVDIDRNDIEQYRTDYIGDAPNVAAIALRLPYPQGYTYASIELQNDLEPYELIIYLDGNQRVEQKDFEPCARQAFSLIGNMGMISFRDAATLDVIASFQREDHEEN